jgi:Na+-translocating ferredoxin:NAD+ oxidoreductase RnfA subunit
MSKIITRKSASRTMWKLMIINLIIITLDCAFLTLEYLNLSVLEQTFKGIAYSYKLKIEFAILGKLVSIAQTHSGA